MDIATPDGRLTEDESNTKCTDLSRSSLANVFRSRPPSFVQGNSMMRTPAPCNNRRITQSQGDSTMTVSAPQAQHFDQNIQHTTKVGTDIHIVGMPAARS